MNKLVGLLTLCVVCAIVQAALVALVVAIMLAMLFSFIIRPRETLLFIGILALMALANAHPLACIIAIGVIGVGMFVIGSKRKGLEPRRLTDGREHPSQDPGRLDRDLPG